MGVKPLTQQEFIDMARLASEEIRALHARIDHLQPRAEAYESICRILGMMPGRSAGAMGEDLAWRLDRRVRELEEAGKAGAA